MKCRSQRTGRRFRRQVAQGKAQIIKLFPVRCEQEIALIAGGIGSAVHFNAPGALHAADVVAGNQCRGAQLPRGCQQILELDPLIAADTGNGGGTGQIIIDEFINYGGAKAVLVIQHIMGNAQTTGHLFSVMDIGTGATGTSTLDGLTMIVKLQGNADHFIARALA